MRISLLLMAFVLVAFPATAQTDYETVADSTSLVDGGILADVDISCMAQMPSGDFVFFNFPTGDLVTHDPDAAPGSRTAILRSNAQINSDLNNDAESCFAITVDGSGNVYAALQDSTNTDQIYKTDGSTGTRLAEADGMTGIAVTGSTVYLSRVAFFGAPEDGFYSINTTDADQTPAVVITDSGLDLVDLAIGSDGSLYASSSEFGSSGSGLRNVVVKVTDPAGSPSLSVIYDPFGDGIFTNGGDGGLEDLELRAGSPDRLYLYNNSFGAADGEQWGTVLVDGTSGEQFADQSMMVGDADTNLGGYTPPGGRSMVLNGNSIFVASRDAFGGDDNIVELTNFPPVPVANFTIDADPEAQTVAAPGTAAFTYVVCNNTASPVSGVVFFEAFLGASSVAGPTTVQSGSLPANTCSPTLSFSVNVPGAAPAATYSVEISAGPSNGVAIATDAVDVTVTSGGRAAGTSTEWTLGAASPWPTFEAAARTSDVGAYPNPFVERTEIAFSLESASDVSLVVYDVRGREVATLTDGTLEAGAHSVTFDGASLPSGMYVYRLVSGTQVETGRITLVK